MKEDEVIDRFIEFMKTNISFMNLMTGNKQDISFMIDFLDTQKKLFLGKIGMNKK